LIHRFAQRSWPCSLVSHLEDEQDNTPKIHTTKLSGIHCQKNEITTATNPFNPKQVRARLEMKPTKKMRKRRRQEKIKEKREGKNIRYTSSEKKLHYLITNHRFSRWLTKSLKEVTE
jgi:hypothetical protein